MSVDRRAGAGFEIDEEEHAPVVHRQAGRIAISIRRSEPFAESTTCASMPATPPVVELVQVVAGADRVVRMLQRRAARAHDVESAETAAHADVEMAEQHEPAPQRGQNVPEGSGVGQSVAQLQKAMARVDRWVVDQDDRDSSRDFRVVEDRLSGPGAVRDRGSRRR